MGMGMGMGISCVCSVCGLCLLFICIPSPPPPTSPNLPYFPTPSSLFPRTHRPLEKTESLKAARKRAVIAKIEERIKTSADREFYARQKIRNEIVEKANDGDVDGVFAILHMVAEEAEKSQERPRVNAEARNDQGLSLLAIAARNDDVVLAERLITHWQECDKDRWYVNHPCGMAYKFRYDLYFMYDVCCMRDICMCGMEYKLINTPSLHIFTPITAGTSMKVSYRPKPKLSRLM